MTLSGSLSAQTLDNGKPSIFVSYPNSAKDHGEVATDKGSMTYPDLFKDFFSGGAGTWESLPLVDYATYRPAPADVQVVRHSGQVNEGPALAKLDPLTGSEECVSYEWEKGLFWTGSNWSTFVVAWPLDGNWATEQDPENEDARNALFIVTRGTGGDIHNEPVPADNVGICGSNPLSGPKLIAAPALDAIRKGHAVAYNVGGGGSHVWWHQLQRNLELRYYALDRLKTVLEGLEEPIVEEVYAMGFSYGGIISEYLVQLFPAQFDGAVCFDNTLRGVQATLGIHRANSAGAMAGPTRFTLSPHFFWLAVDHFMIGEVERVLQSGLLPAQMGTTPLSTSFAATNLDLLDRIDHYFTSGSSDFPVMRPILCLTGDEDHTVFYGNFRPEIEEVLKPSRVFPGTSIPISKYVKLITLPFDEHGGFQAIELVTFPSKYYEQTHPGGLPHDGTPVENILAMRAEMETDLGASLFTKAAPPNDWDYTVTNPPIDIGTPGPLQASDYVFDESYANPNWKDSGTGSLNLTQAWGGAGTRPYVGMGIDLGFQNSMLVLNVDGDSDPDIFFGDGSGYVQWWEWDEPSDALVWRWRSLDLGAAVCSLDAGEIGSEDVIVGATAGGQLFSIHTFTTSHTAVVDRLLGNPTPDLLTYGGGRERPTLAIGSTGQGTTAVHVSGSHVDFQSVPAVDYKQCLLQLNFTNKNTFSGPASAAERKQLETLTNLIPLDAGRTKFLGLSWRGYAYHLQADAAGGLTFDTTLQNSGLGEYLGLSPLDADRVTTSQGTFDLVVGIGSIVGSPVKTPAPELSNFALVNSNGDVKLSAKITDHNGILCIKALKVSGSQVMFVVGTALGKVAFFTLDTAFPYTTNMVDDRDLIPPTLVQSEDFGTTFGVTSLDTFTVTAGGPLGGFGPSVGPGGASIEQNLVGVTNMGILFLWEYTIDSSLNLTIVEKHYEEPLYGAFGIGIYDNKDHTGGSVCPGGEEKMLVALPRQSYARDRDGATATDYGPAAFALRATTGDVCRKRQKNVVGITVDAQALNPRYNPFEIDPTDPLEQALHVGYETLTPVDFGDPDSGIDVIQTSKQGGTWFIQSGATTLRGFPVENATLEPTEPLSEMFFSNRADGPKVNIGNAIRAGDLVEDASGFKEEVVLTTTGGRIVVLQWDTPNIRPQALWKSWNDQSGPNSDLFTFGGDYGGDYAGLALFDVHQFGSQAPEADAQVEVFTTGYRYQDPTNITGGLTSGLSNGEADRNSRILLFDWDATGSQLSLIHELDLGEPGAMGLWAGANLGAPDATYPVDVVVGLSQNFRVYGFDPDTLTYTLRWESEWLGSSLGAFNSIQVLRAQPEGEGVVDYVFLGSDGYVYAYKTPVYTP